jgi:Zn-dependent protease with chaperone function
LDISLHKTAQADSAGFRGLLFGAGCPAAGLPVTAHFDQDRLVAQGNGLDISVTADGLVVAVGGMEQAELSLNWLDTAGRQASLRVADEQEIAAMMRNAPDLLQPQFGRWHQRKRHVTHLWGWLGGMLALALVAVCVAWWAYPHLTGWVAARVPVSVEQKLGEAALAQLQADGQLIDSGPAQQAVRQLGDKLTRGSRYRYRWFVKKDDSVNAFAMPGGIVVVHTGLLRKAANANEVAGVLAHEVQHIEQRHSLKQAINSLGLAAIVFTTIGDISSVSAVLAHQLGSMVFSREMEEEADRLGLLALVRANIKPDGMLSFFRKMEQAQRTGGMPAGKNKEPSKAESSPLPEWMSSHPQTARRIGQIETLISQNPCPACRDAGAELDWPAVVASAGGAAGK